MWRATQFALRPNKLTVKISIHTLRVEGDGTITLTIDGVDYISIHTLRVEGDITRQLHKSVAVFISIHTLRVEGDVVRLL